MMLFCVHTFVIFFGPLFLSLSKYIYFPPFVFFFVVGFFCHIFFFVTFYTRTKSAALEETTTRLFRPPHVVVNGQPTLDERAESAGARPPPPPSPCFFCSRASESFTFFCKRDDAMSSSLAERSRYITIRKRLTQRDFCLLV